MELRELIDGARGLPGIRLDRLLESSMPGDPTAAAARTGSKTPIIIRRSIT